MKRKRFGLENQGAAMAKSLDEIFQDTMAQGKRKSLDEIFGESVSVPALKEDEKSVEKEKGLLDKLGQGAKDAVVGFADNPIGRKVFQGLNKLTGQDVKLSDYKEENPALRKLSSVAGEVAATIPGTIVAPELSISKAPLLLKTANAAIKGGASMVPAAAESASEGKYGEAATELGSGMAFGGGLSVLGSGLKRGGRALLDVAKDKIGMPTRLGAHVANVNPRAMNDIVTGKVPYSEVKKITRGGEIGYEQGQALKETLDSPELFSKDRRIVSDALEQMPEFDLTPTIEKIDNLISETPKFSAGGRVAAHLEKLKKQLTEMKTPPAGGVEKGESRSLWDWARQNKIKDDAFKPYIGNRAGETREFVQIKSKDGLSETELAEKFANDFPDLAKYYGVTDERGMLTNTNHLLELLANPGSAKKTAVETVKQGDLFYNPIQDIEPNVTVSAKKYKEMRSLLDSEIDWKQPHAAALDQKLKAIRTSMKNDLIATAEDAGVGPEYVAAMKRWANNIDRVSELRKRVSTNPQSFMNNVMTGPNKTKDKILLKALDEMTGKDFTGEARKLATVKGLGLSDIKQTLFGISNAANGMMLAGGGLGAAIGGAEGGGKGAGLGAAAGALAFSPLGVYTTLRTGNAIRRGLGKGMVEAGENLEGLQGINKIRDKGLSGLSTIVPRRK